MELSMTYIIIITLFIIYLVSVLLMPQSYTMIEGEKGRTNFFNAIFKKSKYINY